MKVIILDDDKDFLKLMEIGLSDSCHECVFKYKVKDFYKAITNEPTLCLLDYYMEDGETGVDVMRTSKEINPLTYFIFMSAIVHTDMLLDIIKEGWAFHFLLKGTNDFFEKLEDMIKNTEMNYIEKIRLIIEANEKINKAKERIFETIHLIENLSEENGAIKVQANC